MKHIEIDDYLQYLDFKLEVRGVFFYSGEAL